MPTEQIRVLSESANRQIRALAKARSNDGRKELLDEIAVQLADPGLWIAGPRLSAELPVLDGAAGADGDATAAIGLHRALAGLSRVEASDSRLWNALSLTYYKDYVETRWPDRRGKFESWSSRRLLPVNVTAMRPLARHALTRLWWTARMLHDPYLTMPWSRETRDPYAYVKVAFEVEDLRAGVMERNYWGLGGFPLLIFETVRELGNDSRAVSREQYRDLFKRALVMTGYTRVDFLVSADSERVLKYLREKIGSEQDRV